jgi:D-alanyl-D-alanine carboxypeptidase
MSRIKIKIAQSKIKSTNPYFTFILLTSLFIILVVASMIPADKPAFSGKIPSKIKKNIYKIIPLNKNTSHAPVLSAPSYVVFDETTATFLLTKNADARMLPASTSKIATALVALGAYPLNQIITIEIPQIEGQKMGLTPGEQISVNDLIHGLLISSANDAAYALAVNYPGGLAGFVEEMNSLSRKIGLKNTHFENPIGFDGEGQYTTSKDLITLSRYAMTNPVFAEIVAKSSWTAKSLDQNTIHSLKNINILLNEVDGVMGIKTGWTENAKENLVTYITRDGKKLYIAVLGSQDRFDDTKKLINWIFENFDWVQVKQIIYL